MEQTVEYKYHQNRVIEMRECDFNKKEIEEQKSNVIIFVLNGEGRVRLNSHLFQTVKTNEFFFVPKGFMIEWFALDRLSLLAIHPESLAGIYSVLKMDESYRERDRDKKEDIENIAATEGLFILEANKQIRTYVSTIKEYIETGLNDVGLFNIKVNEFLVLFKILYSQEEIRSFFRVIVDPNILFAEFIKCNYTRYKTIKELAGAMHITQTQFSVKFKNVFNASPRQWIIRQKTMQVQRDIIENEKTNKEIALDNGFNNPQQFYDFCRIRIGLTPAQIREKYNGNGVEKEE